MIPLPVPKTVPGFLANLLAALALTFLSVAYLAWRFGPGSGDEQPTRDWLTVAWGAVAVGLGPILAPAFWFNAGLFLWGRLKRRVGEPTPGGEGGVAAAARNPFKDLAVAAACLAVVGCLAVAVATRPMRTGADALASVGLAFLSLPFTFGMIPAVRRDVWRWARWLLLRR